MADTIDSISIELTASTQKAENSIQRVIDMLSMLKAAAIDASAEARINKTIRSIAKAAKEVDSDAGQRLARLAGGLNALSKVGDLSNLSTAGKNLASIIKAVSNVGKSSGVGSLAREIRDVGDALGVISNSDAERLRAVSDSLSGETSGPIHTSNIGYESAELGGGRASFETGGDMAAYGAMTVFKYIADSIRDATSAYREFTAALGKGVPPVFTEFVDGARQAKAEVLELGNAIKGLLAGAVNWEPGSNSDTFWRSGSQIPLLKSFEASQNFTMGGKGIDKSQAIEIEDLGETAVSAAAGFERLSEAERFANFRMKPLEDEAASTSARLRQIGDEAGRSGGLFSRLLESARNAASHIRIFGRSAKEAGENAEKSTSGISKFLNSLKRVAMYRFMRAIIRGITEAFKEGIQNLYQWSSAVNGTFAKSMDRIATSTLYLKNSLGAMLAPLINTLAPVIEWIIDRIVDVINWINKLFAALSGSQTYTVAKKVATKWEEAGKSAAGSARKAADDIRRTILGFDEINKLEKQNTTSSSGGSGSGNTGTDYTNMFEERKLDGWMSKLASFIDKFKLGVPAVLGGILAGFEAVKLAIKAVSSLSFGWLKDMAGKTIDIAVTLTRKGWETIKKWALSFGEAVVDLAVKIKTSALELWAKFSAAWQALSPVLKVGIIASVTAAALWAAYKLAWSLAPEKVLEIQTAITQTAKSLWEGLKKGWLSIPARVLMFSVAIVQTAKGLWDGLKKSWSSIQSRVLQFSVAIVQTAKSLWEGLKKSWTSIQSRVLQFSVAIVQTAKSLWEGFKKSWVSISSRVVQFSVSIVQTAKGLWDGLKKSWDSIQSRVLQFSVAIVQTAKGLWEGLRSSWVAITSRVVQFSVSIAQTAAGLWNGLKQSWLAIQARVVQFSVAISQTAAGLWNGLRTSWNSIASRVVMFSVSIVQTAQGLWNSLKSSWEKIPQKVVTFQTQISTTMSSLWDWVKKNWEKVALGALGIAIAIATPWGTIATALSGLWSQVMASFGGALSFGVLPTFGKVDVKTKMATGNATPSEIKKYVQDNIAKPMQDLLSEEDYEIWISAHPGRGFKQNNLSRKQAFELDDSIQQELNNNPLEIPADLKKDWYGTPQSALGVDNLKSTVDVDMWAPWNYWHTPPIKWLQMDDLKSTVSVDMWTPWWATNRSPLQWLQMDNLVATVDVVANVTNAQNTIKAATNLSGSYQTKAFGGIFSANRWTDIPQYAGGTLNAHGSLFLAGEAGPEIVGHVGGRTEVLNKSQIAAAMYSAVQAAMAPVTATMAYAAQSMGGSDTEIDYTGMYDIIRDAVAQALANDSGSREQTQLLRQISDKDFTAEITTSSMNKAQTRMNRRAGVTLVPVGT